MPRPSSRPLTLHVSALSNAEYAAYTASLAEATAPAPDVEWGDMSIGVLEARGWIKGRYGAAVDGAVIDQILRYFCPSLLLQDALSAGQFFAALRLVSHAQNGAIVHEDLVFVQANPERERTSSPHKPKSRPTSSSSKPAPPPPPRPTDTSTTQTSTPTLPLRTPIPPIPSPNPFRPTSTSHPSTSPVEPLSSNPFRRSSNPNPPPPSVSSSSASSSPQNPRQYASPPLPPRKPLLPPPRHASLSTKSGPTPSILPFSGPPAKAFPVTYPHPAPAPPIKPPKPPTATSHLIKQSLQAAKGAASKKEELEGLRKTRKLEVIGRSSAEHENGTGPGGGSSSGSGSSGRGSRNGVTPTHTGPTAPIMRPPSPPASFYDVAHARIAARSTSSSTPSSSSSDDAPPSPDHAHTRTHTDPTHTRSHDDDPTSWARNIRLEPATPSSPASPFTSTHFPNSSGPPTPPNPRRTKSLHHPRTSMGGTTATPPVPPPRRRPESAQITPSPPHHPHPHAPSSQHANGASPSPLSRHLSFTSTASTLHRAFENLKPGVESARAGLESARVRAEGRVWPGGYVKGLGVGRDGEGEGGRLVNGHGEDGGFGQDVDYGERAEGERDGDKLVAGEGWRPL